MTAKEFWNTQVPTDANKCYVHDYYARKFSHEDLFRFAEAYAALKVAETTKEMYPAAFLEWAGKNANILIYPNSRGNWLLTRVVTGINPSVEYDEYTTDELFEYWKENIQGK